MANKQVFLNGPKNVNIRRHEVGDNTYFTIGAVTDKTQLKFRKLVATARDNQFSWIHSDFSA